MMPTLRLRPETIQGFTDELKLKLRQVAPEEKLPKSERDDLLRFVDHELNMLFNKAREAFRLENSNNSNKGLEADVVDGQVQYSKESDSQISLEIDPRDVEMLKSSIANSIMQEFGGPSSVEKGAAPSAPSKLRNTLAKLIRPVKITNRTKRSAVVPGENPWKKAFNNTDLFGTFRELDAQHDMRIINKDKEAKKSRIPRLTRKKPNDYWDW